MKVDERTLIFETHPVQYHAPVYREVARRGVPLHVVYGSNFSIAGAMDEEFGTKVAWDLDLTEGYSHEFLATTDTGGPADYASVQSNGVDRILSERRPTSAMVLGYACDFDRGAIDAIRKSGVPILMRAETTDHALNRSWIKKKARDHVLRQLYRQLSAVMYVGSRSKDHYQRLGVDSERMFFSPYCVSVEQWPTDEQSREELRPLARQELGIAEDRIAILYTGKVVQRKGVHLIPEAIEQLPETLKSKVELIVMGTGEKESELRRQTSSLRTHFLGFQNQSQLSRYFHASDLSLVPSLYSETWGLVVNEALHHGLPCVVSEAVGSGSDLIIESETGAVMSELTAKALGKAIERVCEIPPTASARQRCREVAEGFSVARAADGIQNAIKFVNRRREAIR